MRIAQTGTGRGGRDGRPPPSSHLLEILVPENLEKHTGRGACLPALHRLPVPGHYLGFSFTLRTVLVPILYPGATRYRHCRSRVYKGRQNNNLAHYRIIVGVEGAKPCRKQKSKKTSGQKVEYLRFPGAFGTKPTHYFFQTQSNQTMSNPFHPAH
jgi:hypothetical protein